MRSFTFLFALLSSIFLSGWMRGPALITPVYLPPVAGISNSGGTELMGLVVHTDATGTKIYASNGYWLSTTEYNTVGAQILSFGSDLHVTQDVQFSPCIQIANSLNDFTIAYDYLGAPTTDKILMTGFKVINCSGASNPVNTTVALRNDSGGHGTLSGWTTTVLQTPTIAATAATQARSMAYHTDTGTGAPIGRVYVGVDPVQNGGLAAIFSATYNQTSHSLTWGSTPELEITAPPDCYALNPSNPACPYPNNMTWRVMAMTECNGRLFASVGPAIYVRNDDTATWSLFGIESLIPNWSSSISGYRGMTCATGSDGVTLELLMTTEGEPAWVVAYDTTTGGETDEFHITTDISLNRLNLPGEATYIICSYNNIFSIGWAGGNYLLGCEIKLGTFNFVSPGVCSFNIPNERTHVCEPSYYHRNATGTTYTWHQLPSLFPQSSAQYPATAARTFVASPFPNDHNVLFVGGYDANTDRQVPYILATNPTAWIYRVLTYDGQTFP